MKTSTNGSLLNHTSEPISIGKSESEALSKGLKDRYGTLGFRIGELFKKNGYAFYRPTLMTLVVVRAESDFGPGSSGASGSDL